MSSWSIISWSFRRIVSQATSSPPALVVPPQKNFRSGKMPRGDWIHLSSTARLTVVTWTLTLSAICCIFKGSIASGPLSRNSRLVIDDRLGHAQQRVAALLDRVDEPLGGTELLLDVFAGFGAGLGTGQQLAVVGADEEARRAAVFEPHRVDARLAQLDDHVGLDHRSGDLLEVGPGIGIQLAEVLDDLVDHLHRVAGPPRDHRKAVLLDVFQVVGNQPVEFVVIRHSRNQLQEETLPQVAGADAGRIELLDQGQGLPGQGQVLFGGAGPDRRLPGCTGAGRWGPGCR